MINTKYVYPLITLLLISILTNAYLIATKGIKINNTYFTEHHQHQEQNQAQMVVGFFASKGKIEWKKYSIVELMSSVGQGLHEEVLIKFLNTLPPEQSLFSKVVYTSDGLVVFVPSIKEGL